MQLDHIQLAMPPGKEDQARRFFIDLLGMAEEAKPSPLDTRGGCWFRRDAVRLHVGVEADFAPQRKAHPAFTVEDLAGLATRLAEADFPVKWDNALRDRQRFYTTDPFGNRLEFLRAGDGFRER